MAAVVPLALLRRSTTVRPSVKGRGGAADHAVAFLVVLVETPMGSQVAPAGSVTSAEPNGSVLVRDPQRGSDTTGPSGPQFLSLTDTVVGVPATTETGLTLSV